MAQDEAILVHDAGSGSWLWTRRGERAHVLHAGSHREVAPCAPVTLDGRRYCEVRDGFDAPTFPGYIRGLHRKFGRVTAVPGRAPQHRASAVMGFLEDCGGGAELLRLPVGTSEPSEAGALWHQLWRMLAGMYFRGFDDFWRKVGSLLRTTPHSPDMLASLYRRLGRDLVAARPRTARRRECAAARTSFRAGMTDRYWDAPYVSHKFA